MEQIYGEEYLTKAWFCFTAFVRLHLNLCVNLLKRREFNQLLKHVFTPEGTGDESPSLGKIMLYHFKISNSVKYFPCLY